MARASKFAWVKSTSDSIVDCANRKAFQHASTSPASCAFHLAFSVPWVLVSIVELGNPGHTSNRKSKAPIAMASKNIGTAAGFFIVTCFIFFGPIDAPVSCHEQIKASANRQESDE